MPVECFQNIETADETLGNIRKNPASSGNRNSKNIDCCGYGGLRD
jgi:hypothetical protein